MLKGEMGSLDIFRNTVKSAIQTIKQALFNLEDPSAYMPEIIEVHQARIKEGEFYKAFLERL